MKKWLKKNKKTILKTLLVLLIITAIALSTFFILRACGFTTKEKWNELRTKLGENLWFWAIVVGMQVIQVVFIPISNSLISAPLALIFTNDLWKLFIASWVGISIGTVILYFIGKYGGEKLCNWILSDKDKTQKMKDLMQKGKAFFVIGDLIPFIPNDLITVLSGMAGYNFFFVLIVTLLTRAACIATTIYIFGYIKQFPWLIAVLIALLAFMIFAAVYVTKKQLKKDNTEQENTTHVRKNTKM